MTPFELRQLVEYDPETGFLTWKPRDGNARFNSKLAGKPALAQPSKGYRTGRIKGKNYKAHRAAWAVTHGEWPQGQIDHINGDRSDNRLSNLRAVSQSENGKNQKTRSTRRMEAPMLDLWNWLLSGGWQIAAMLFLGAIVPWERGDRGDA